MFVGHFLVSSWARLLDFVKSLWISCRVRYSTHPKNPHFHPCYILYILCHCHSINSLNWELLYYWIYWLTCLCVVSEASGTAMLLLNSSIWTAIPTAMLSFRPSNWKYVTCWNERCVSVGRIYCQISNIIDCTVLQLNNWIILIISYWYYRFNHSLFSQLCA